MADTADVAGAPRAAASRADALVVGAGPTGLTMAAELARHGVGVRLVDRLAEPATQSRALALQSRTVEVFDQMGVAEAALARGLPVRALNIYAEGRRLMRVGFDDLDGPYPFTLDLSQSETEALLAQHAARLGVRAERGVELTGLAQDASGVRATLRHADGREETAAARWLIGCDGAHSAVRHALGVPFAGTAYPQALALADVRMEWALPANEAQLFLHGDGLLAAFPLPGGRHRLIVEVAARADEEPTPDPTLEEIQGYVARRGAPRARVSDPAWLATFRTHLREARDWRRGCVFLAGDAAHIHSPAGGQGMNTGIQDAYNLGWKLGLVRAGRAPEALLESYQAERRPVAERVLRTTDALARTMMLRSPLAQGLRDRLLPLLAQLEVIRQRFEGQLSELDVQYRASPIVGEGVAGGPRGRPAGPRAGDRAPEAGPLLAAGGAPTRFFELLRGTRHTLLLFAAPGPGSARRVDALAGAVAARYADVVATYVVAAEAPAGASAATTGVAGAEAGDGGAVPLRDPEGALRRRYAGAAECAYLIRPDGYVGYRGLPADAAALEAYLGRIFLPRG